MWLEAGLSSRDNSERESREHEVCDAGGSGALVSCSLADYPPLATVRRVAFGVYAWRPPAAPSLGEHRFHSESVSGFCFG